MDLHGRKPDQVTFGRRCVATPAGSRLPLILLAFFESVHIDFVLSYTGRVLENIMSGSQANARTVTTLAVLD